MTREQLIILGFIVAAFVVGWLTSTLTSALAGRPRRVPAAATPLVAEEVSDALQNDTANESMMSVLRAGNGGGLSELELDLTEWGFTYGVAWAQAREQRAGAADDAIAGEALHAAENVFDAYADDSDWKQRMGQRAAG